MFRFLPGNEIRPFDQPGNGVAGQQIWLGPPDVLYLPVLRRFEPEMRSPERNILDRDEVHLSSVMAVDREDVGVLSIVPAYELPVDLVGVEGQRAIS